MFCIFLASTQSQQQQQQHQLAINFNSFVSILALKVSFKKDGEKEGCVIFWEKLSTSYVYQLRGFWMLRTIFVMLILV